MAIRVLLRFLRPEVGLLVLRAVNGYPAGNNLRTDLETAPDHAVQEMASPRQSASYAERSSTLPLR